MTRWSEFAAEHPDMAEAGRALLYQFRVGLGYLATIRKDGGPRVHPVCAVIANGGLYVFIGNQSPKVHDLQRDGRYALHSFPNPQVDDEFSVIGRASRVDDQAVRQIVYDAYTATGAFTSNDTLFELWLERALHAKYGSRPSWPPRYTKWSSTPQDVAVVCVEVTAVDHIYVAVTDMQRSEQFYDAVMNVLGFRKGTKPINNERHLHYFNPITQYTIRPAKTPGAQHDPYGPGLHHVCFRVASPNAVDAAARELRQLGIEVTDPKLYPEYAPDYYATFFSDPDGIRLEVVAHRRLRSLIRYKWHELTEFEDPLTKAGLL